MRLREATHQDIPALVELINAAYRVEDFFVRGDRTSTEEISALMGAANGRFLVYEGDSLSRPAGTVYASIHGTRGHFSLLAVHPDQQGKGLARRLIAAVEQFCSTAGCNVVELDVFNVRHELPPFYASCGYIATGTSEFSNPEILTMPAHLIQMTKRLAAALLPSDREAAAASIRA